MNNDKERNPINNRDKSIDDKIKKATGKGLRLLRESNNLSLDDAAAMSEKSVDKLLSIERGQRTINLFHFMQLLSCYGGRIVIEADNGFRYDIWDEYNVPVFTEGQRTAIKRSRELELKKLEARRWFEETFGSTTDSGESDRPIHRRPRIKRDE